MTPLALRTKLTLVFTALLALLLTAVGVVYYQVLARQLDAAATTDLRELTAGLHGFLRFDGGVPSIVYDQNDPDQVAFVERATRYYQIFDASNGRLLVQSAAMAPLGLEYTPAEVIGFRQRPGIQDVTTDRGRVRILTSVIAPGAAEAFLLQVGLRLDTIDQALDRFLELLLWSIPASIVVAMIAARWMAGRALAPMARLAAASRAIDVSDLRRRLPQSGAGDELDALAAAFNDTLARLEHAIADMKQFSTALAHELRTPLAALRGETELALMQARSPEEYRRGLASQLEELDRLTRLINQLLTLARAEAGDIPLARNTVDLGALAATVVQSLAPVAQARGIELSCESSEIVHVTGDEGWLERLLLNLLDNAIRFTPRGGRIVVRTGRDRGVCTLEVRDTGVGIEAGDLPHIFERFYQADPSRSVRGEGVGLGLSLARWIALRHNATIDAASEPGAGSTFTVRFPRG